MAKSILLSRTFWLNALTGIAALLAALSGSDVIPPAFAPYLVTALAVVNIALRVVTTQPVTLAP